MARDMRHNRCLSCRSKSLKKGESYCINCSGPERTTEKQCKTCGKYFVTLNPKQNYCDIDCICKYKIPEEEKVFDVKTRWEVLERDHFKCRYCGATARGDIVLHVDHIIPRSKGGAYVKSNLFTACHLCNRGKSDKELSPENLAIINQRFAG